MKKTLFSTMLLLSLGWLTAAHAATNCLVRFSVNDSIVDSIYVAQGATFDHEDGAFYLAVSDGLPGFWYEFAGWSRNQSVTSPAFFTPNDTVTSDMTLYAAYYRRNETVQSLVPVSGTTEFDRLLSGYDDEGNMLNPPMWYVGYDTDVETYLFASSPDEVITDSFGLSTALHRTCVPTYANRQQDGSYTSFEGYNAMTSYIMKPDSSNYIVYLGDGMMGWYVDQDGLAAVAETNSERGYWSISFSADGYATLVKDSLQLAFNQETMTFYGSPVNRESRFRLYYLKSEQKVAYTYGYHTLVLNQPEEGAYLSFDWDDIYSDPDGMYLVEGSGDQTYYVLREASVVVTCELMLGYKLDSWDCSFVRYNGGSDREKTLVVSQNMVLGVTLVPDTRSFYAISINGEVTVKGGFAADMTPLTDNYIYNKELLYIVQGTGVTLEPVIRDTGYVFGYWMSYDSLNHATPYHGRTEAELTLVPTMNMMLGIMLQPKKPAGWYTVTIPASTIGYGMEEALSEDGYDSSYGSHVHRVDGADESLTVYVKPGYGFYLYTNVKYDMEGNPTADYSYNDLIRFASNDSVYNDTIINFGNTIIIYPHGDMTLTVAAIGSLEDLYLAANYWKISLPRMDISDEMTQVMYFDYKQMYDTEEKPDTMGGGTPDDNYTMEPAYVPEAGPISSYIRRVARRTPIVADLGDYVLSETNCTETYDSVSGASVRHCDAAIYVRRGKEVTLFVPFLFRANDYRFGQWTSSDSTINGATNHPITFAPTADMTLDFTLETAGAVTVIGNDTIAFSDTLQTTITITDDGSVTFTFDNGEGAAEITLDSAMIAGSGFVSELNQLIFAIENNSSITTNGIGIKFEGTEMSIESPDSALLIVSATTPLVGNGINALYISTSVIFSSQASPDGLQQPAISGFANVQLADGLSVQEVWYGLTKGDPAACFFSKIFGSFGRFDTIPANTSAPRHVRTRTADDDFSDGPIIAFVPATAICIASPFFYVDYIDGKIDVDVATGIILPENAEGYSLSGVRTSAEKVLLNGHLFILTQEGLFDATGRKVCRYLRR